MAAILGSNVKDVAATLAHYGADKVLVADSDALKDYTPEGYAAVVTGIIKEHNPDLVIFGANSFGKDLAPRVAAKLDIGVASDCIDFEAAGEGFVITRPIYAGKVIARVKMTKKPAIATIRPNIFAAPQPDESLSAEMIDVAVDTGEIKTKVIEVITQKSDRPQLTEADIIVSGGRGLKEKENYKLIEELADILGAATGASRAIVDEGWVDHSNQVGQTGKVVSPSLYIAIGISGAIQHLAGMGSSKVIMAINKDPEAPIFNVADYGIVADLFQAVPILKEELKKALAT